MAKKKGGKPKREVTRRQLSHWQRQKRRQRIVFGVGIFIIIVVVCTIGIPWYITEYRPLQQTVIMVNETEFDMDYYIKVLKLNNTYYLTGDVVKFIEQNELVRQKAPELGANVSDSEVDEELKNYNPPLSKDYRDVFRAQLLIGKLWDDYFDKQVPEYANQRNIMAMLLNSESQVSEVKARLEAGEEFTELASELSLDSYSKLEKGDLGWLPEGVLSMLLDSSIPEEYAFGSEVGVFSPPIYDEAKDKYMGYWLIKILERREDSPLVHLQVMLLGNEEEAKMIRVRLEAGEDFNTLAGEYSKQKGLEESPGDWGWVNPGIISSAFDEFAFNPEIELDTLSEVIRDSETQTAGGYWLIKVLAEEDDKEIEEDNRNLMKSGVLDKWVTSLWDDPGNEIEVLLDDEKIGWAQEKAVRGLAQ